MSTQPFEPMSIGGIIDRAFKLFRMNFIRFITIAAIMYVPIALLQIIATAGMSGASVPVQTGGAFTTDMMEEVSPTESEEGNYPTEAMEEGNYEFAPMTGPNVFVDQLGLFLVMIILSVLAYQLCNAALLKNVSESYLGRDVTVGQAYKFVLPKLGTLIWAALLVGLVTMLGFMLCMVPGVIFTLWFAMTTPAIVVENLTAGAGMRRSKELASGNLGKIMSVLFIMFVISLIVGWLLAAIGGLLGNAVIGEGRLAGIVINQLFQMIGQVLVAPIGAAASILLYYDMRIRKEGFDLEMLAQSLASPEALGAGAEPRG